MKNRNKPSSNLAAIILNRELSGKTNSRPSIELLLESSYFSNSDRKHLAKDFPLNDTVLSTIAVAISPDGETVATSHGDHTIKIFKYYSGEQIRLFRGHPRTPWTVKYHSKDSNIVASGCLGYEVRVWDIAKGVCANVLRFEYSIISIAFHPAGQFIVIGSGPQLYTWDWKEDIPAVHGGGHRPLKRRLIVHSRNIRAVIFHPKGEHLFVAAPDPPRLPQATFTPCRLYAFKFSDITTVTDGQTQPIELWTLPALVPQIHLYSDGGLDISQCGNYILTCAILYVNPLTQFGGTKGLQIGSFSPISHRERSDADDLAGPIPLRMWGQGSGMTSSIWNQGMPAVGTGDGSFNDILNSHNNQNNNYLFSGNNSNNISYDNNNNGNNKSNNSGNIKPIMDAKESNNYNDSYNNSYASNGNSTQFNDHHYRENARDYNIGLRSAIQSSNPGNSSSQAPHTGNAATSTSTFASASAMSRLLRFHSNPVAATHTGMNTHNAHTMGMSNNNLGVGGGVGAGAVTSSTSTSTSIYYTETNKTNSPSRKENHGNSDNGFSHGFSRNITAYQNYHDNKNNQSNQNNDFNNMNNDNHNNGNNGEKSHTVGSSLRRTTGVLDFSSELAANSGLNHQLEGSDITFSSFVAPKLPNSKQFGLNEHHNIEQENEIEIEIENEKEMRKERDKERERERERGRTKDDKGRGYDELNQINSMKSKDKQEEKEVEKETPSLASLRSNSLPLYLPPSLHTPITTTTTTYNNNNYNNVDYNNNDINYEENERKNEMKNEINSSFLSPPRNVLRLPPPPLSLNSPPRTRLSRKNSASPVRASLPVRASMPSQDLNSPSSLPFRPFNSSIHRSFSGHDSDHDRSRLTFNQSTTSSSLLRNDDYQQSYRPLLLDSTQNNGNNGGNSESNIRNEMPFYSSQKVNNGQGQGQGQVWRDNDGRSDRERERDGGEGTRTGEREGEGDGESNSDSRGFESQHLRNLSSLSLVLQGALPPSRMHTSSRSLLPPPPPLPHPSHPIGAGATSASTSASASASAGVSSSGSSNSSSGGHYQQQQQQQQQHHSQQQQQQQQHQQQQHSDGPRTSILSMARGADSSFLNIFPSSHPHPHPHLHFNPNTPAYSTGTANGNGNGNGRVEGNTKGESNYFTTNNNNNSNINKSTSGDRNDDTHTQSGSGGGAGGGAGAHSRLQFASSNEYQPIFVDPRRGDIVPEGWKAEESLCVFRLSFLDGELQRPSLHRHKALTGPLLKAVTSAKLSPRGKYALVGYGVRNQGVVEDHPYSHVASEVLSVTDEDLTAISFLLDAEDEVNIAQFHPVPGNGIVYGTKRGKVKVFYRNNYEVNECSASNNVNINLNIVK